MESEQGVVCGAHLPEEAPPFGRGASLVYTDMHHLYLWLRVNVVVYLLAADIVPGSLPSRLRRLTQPVISPPNRFFIPHPSLLTCF